MPRNISFYLTADQIRNRTKTVTRRKGWQFLKPGDPLTACYKCMGLKPGQKVQKLADLEVVSVRRERLDLCDDADALREGFPHMSGKEFVNFFCEHMGGGADQIVTRIEFLYRGEK